MLLVITVCVTIRVELFVINVWENMNSTGKNDNIRDFHYPKTKHSRLHVMTF